MKSKHIVFDSRLEEWKIQKSCAGKQVQIINMRSRSPWIHLFDYWDKRSHDFLHSDYDLEVGILRSGRLRRFQGQHQIDFGPGEVWLGGMWEASAWEVLEAPCREISFGVSPEVLVGQNFPEVPGLQWLAPFTVPPPLRPRVPEAKRARVQLIAELVADLHRELQKEVAENQALPIWDYLDSLYAMCVIEPRAPEAVCLRFRLMLTELLMLLLQDWHEPEHHGHGTPFSQINPAIIRVLQSRRAVTVQEAAHLCGLNRNLFARRFAEIMGLSFTQFDLRHRLNGAEGDLLKGNEPVKVIAARWGFADAPHLHRYFVQNLGCTPTQFRRQPPEMWRASRQSAAKPGESKI